MCWATTLDFEVGGLVRFPRLFESGIWHEGAFQLAFLTGDSEILTSWCKWMHHHLAKEPHWARQHTSVPFNQTKTLHTVCESVGRGLVFWLSIIINMSLLRVHNPLKSLSGVMSIAEPQPRAWFVSTIPHHFFLFLDLVPFLRFGIPHIPGAPPWLFFLPASFSWNMLHASWLEKVTQTHPRVGKEGKKVGVKKKQ